MSNQAPLLDPRPSSDPFERSALYTFLAITFLLVAFSLGTLTLAVLRYGTRRISHDAFNRYVVLNTCLTALPAVTLVLWQEGHIWAVLVGISPGLCLLAWTTYRARSAPTAPPTRAADGGKLGPTDSDTGARNAAPRRRAELVDSSLWTFAAGFAMWYLGCTVRGMALGGAIFWAYAALMVALQSQRVLGLNWRSWREACGLGALPRASGGERTEHHAGAPESKVAEEGVKEVTGGGRSKTSAFFFAMAIYVPVVFSRLYGRDICFA